MDVDAVTEDIYRLRIALYSCYVADPDTDLLITDRNNGTFTIIVLVCNIYISDWFIVTVQVLEIVFFYFCHFFFLPICGYQMNSCSK